MTLQQETPRDRASQRGNATSVAEAPHSLRTSPYPDVVGKGLLAFGRAKVALWDFALTRTEAVQRRALTAIIARSRKTEFGHRYGFGDMESYEDFRAGVPIGDYDSFSPYIDRMRAGERGLLVPEFVLHFGNSSGSSNHGKPKFLPISEVQIKHQSRAGADMLLRYLAWANDGEFTRGYTLGLFPPPTMKREGPVLITSNPALMSTRMPVFSRPLYLPHEHIKLIQNYDEKLRVIAETYLDWDVRAITGTTCWFTLIFEKVLEAARRRGRRVKTVREIWPNLRVLLGGGVSAEPYIPILKSLLGRDDLTLIDSYNATEGGLYATSDFSGARGMLMVPHRGTFFEFVPLEEHEDPHPRRIPLWAVEAGRSYVILVTTVSGLYAYKVGDIVRFTSLSPHRIEFVGRLSGCLSVTQELTTHVEIERAVAYAVAKVPCRTLDFGCGADVGVEGSAKSRYALYVEFDPGAPPADLDAFAAAFDEGMCRENRVYREHRTSEVAILAPRVVPLVAGGAKRFMDEVTGGNVQGKFPRILDDQKKARLLAYVSPTHKDAPPRGGPPASMPS
jgi:GH3 auxin-responsive promoter